MRTYSQIVVNCCLFVLYATTSIDMSDPSYSPVVKNIIFSIDIESYYFKVALFSFHLSFNVWKRFRLYIWNTFRWYTKSPLFLGTIKRSSFWSDQAKIIFIISEFLFSFAGFCVSPFIYLVNIYFAYTENSINTLYKTPCLDWLRSY